MGSNPSWRQSQFRVTVPLLLLLLALAVMLPLVGYAVFTLDRFSTGLNKVEQDALRSRTSSASAAIDREIKGLITVGQTLATSPSLTANTMQAFYLEAKQAIRSTHMNIILVDLKTQQLINTRAEFGTVLPQSSAPEVAQRAIALGKPVVSNVFLERLPKKMCSKWLCLF